MFLCFDSFVFNLLFSGFEIFAPFLSLQHETGIGEGGGREGGGLSM